VGQVRSSDCGCEPARGRPRKEERRTIEAILWRLDNGAKWRSIPAELGDWHHAYLHFRRWTLGSVWDKIMAHVVAEGAPKLAFARLRGLIRRRPERDQTNRRDESAIQLQYWR
jgi:transposase